MRSTCLVPTISAAATMLTASVGRAMAASKSSLAATLSTAFSACAAQWRFVEVTAPCTQQRYTGDVLLLCFQLLLLSDCMRTNACWAARVRAVAIMIILELAPCFSVQACKLSFTASRVFPGCLSEPSAEAQDALELHLCLLAPARPRSTSLQWPGHHPEATAAFEVRRDPRPPLLWQHLALPPFYQLLPCRSVPLLRHHLKPHPHHGGCRHPTAAAVSRTQSTCRGTANVRQTPAAQSTARAACGGSRAH